MLCQIVCYVAEVVRLWTAWLKCFEGPKSHEFGDTLEWYVEVRLNGSTNRRVAPIQFISHDREVGVVRVLHESKGFFRDRDSYWEIVL